MASSRATVPYKGKFTRSWQQLPEEIIKIIATQYLLLVNTTGYCPNTWETESHWPSRMIFTVLRNTFEMEKLMCLCPSWNDALESHFYWRYAITTLDPNDVLKHHSIISTGPTAGSNTAVMMEVKPYHHLRFITSYSCMVCRVNRMYTNDGLGAAKRILSSACFGHIGVCREHRKLTFCGVCLREAPAVENEMEVVCCVENEDEETWPGVDATCRSCRTEFLWRRVQLSAFDREAIGGLKLHSPDWETRQSVDAFIDLGEGNITDILHLAREKHWLRKNTKLPDLLVQAIAANRYASRAEAGETYGSDDEISEEEEEEDPELISLTEDASNIRDIAINDWARNRILDGHWLSPADQWYGYTVPHMPISVPAQHPCPWNRDATYTRALEDGEAEDSQHPRPKTITADIPPSYQLCESVYVAYRRQMREILLPAMTNVVRRIVIECTADGLDPTVKVAKMSNEDVAEALRDEAVWYNGIDWLERRANAKKEQEAERLRLQSRQKDEDESSSSSRSDGSHTTSPVLSTSTLQTTPSPPPSGDASPKDDDSVKSLTTSSAPTIIIPVSPVLKAPELLRPIPYIPVTTSHLPTYSADSLKMIWREAYAPLFHCQCTICQRTAARLALESGNIVPTQVQQIQAQTQAPPPKVHLPPVDVALPTPQYADQYGLLESDGNTIEIQIEEAALDSPPVYEIEEEEGELDTTSAAESTPASPIIQAAPIPRKRKSPDADTHTDGDDGAAKGRIFDIPERTGTPPKRARTKMETPAGAGSAFASPLSARKRPSQELEDEATTNENGDAKRLKQTAAPAEEVILAR